MKKASKIQLLMLAGLFTQSVVYPSIPWISLFYDLRYMVRYKEMQDKVSTEIAQIIDLKIKKQVNEKLLGWATRKISAIKPVSPTKKIALNNKESYSKSKFKFVFENSSFNKSQCLFNKTSQI